jgi:rRNA maturation RNase YbeY
VPVDVTSRRRRRGLTVTAVRDDARRMLRDLGIEGELSVALISDNQMRRLNATYRGKDRPTDVLAFPAAKPMPGDTVLLGDVVISVDTAARQATAAGVSLRDEVRTLLAHGILHLIGYDHERSPAQARRMFRKQRQLLLRLAAGRQVNLSSRRHPSRARRRHGGAQRLSASL